MYKLIAKIGPYIYIAAIVVITVVLTIRDANRNLIREAVIEAGSDIDVSVFFKDCPDDAEFVTDVSQVDTSVPAVYQLKVRYDEAFVKEVTLKIEDHTGPKGIALPKNQYASVEWPDASECVGCLYDLSGIAKIEYRDGTPAIKYTGDYMIPVVVTDWYDNSTVIDVPFHVTDDHNAPLFYGIHDIYVDDSEDAKIDYFEGVTYEDDYDEAPKVAVDESNVVIGQEGVYEITYKAMDAAGNIRIQKANVHVVKQRATNGTYGAGGGWDSSRHNEVYKLANALAKKLKGRNTTETVKNIVTYVHSHVWYTTVRGNQTFEDAVYQALTKHNGDCYGYYCTVKILLDCSGIPNMMVKRYPVKNAGHYWNLVKYGDTWYHCDSTVYQYHRGSFIKATDKKIGDPHHRFDGSGLPVRAGGTPEYVKDLEKESKNKT